MLHYDGYMYFNAAQSSNNTRITLRANKANALKLFNSFAIAR